MKGLIIKDILTLSKQMKIILVFIVVFAFMPGFSGSAFAIVYAAMLPISALAYDERCKWDTLAAMMPYSKKSMVLSKYILGYGLVLIVGIFALVAQCLLSLFGIIHLGVEDIISMIAVICIAMVLQSVNLPFMFKFGVEKGRMIFIVATAAFIFGGIAFSDEIVSKLEAQLSDFMLFGAVAIAVTLIINIISAFLSIKLYERRK